MPYERTQKIGERFERVIALIKYSSYNARQLCQELGVSRPTVHRIVADLKRRGYTIRAIRDGSGWHYEFTGKVSAATLRQSHKQRTNSKRRIDKKNAH